VLSGEDITYPAGAQESTLVVFRLRDPALITNDNLESNMEHDDKVEASAYPFKDYSMGITVPKEVFDDYGTVDLSEESLTQAITKISSMIDTGTVSATSTTFGPIGAASTHATMKSHGRPVEIKPFEVNATMEMLEDASSPYNIDPETLANLWVVRFGKGWVGSEAVEDMDAEENNWWRHAANRLRELGYLEMHTLASSYRVVLRIVE